MYNLFSEYFKTDEAPKVLSPYILLSINTKPVLFEQEGYPFGPERIIHHDRRMNKEYIVSQFTVVDPNPQCHYRVANIRKRSLLQNAGLLVFY